MSIVKIKKKKKKSNNNAKHMYMHDCIQEMLSFPQSKSALFNGNPARYVGNILSLKKDVTCPLPCCTKPTK